MLSRIPQKTFWNDVLDWLRKCYMIALHGYNHVFHTKAAGIIGKNCYGEFAGVSYSKQADMIKKGVSIFDAHGISPQVFVAPAHSFDKNTIRALLENSDIRIISDGFTNDTFFYEGIYWIPQQISSPEIHEDGV